MRKKIIYLSGAIQFSKDPDSWRNLVEKELCSCYNIINPKSQFCPYDVKDPNYKKWIKETFIIPDVEDVFKCDYFLIKIDKDVPRGSGTFSELTIAAYLNKKIVYVLDGITEEKIPGWSLGCLYDAIRVNSIEDAIMYLKEEYKVI